MTHFVIFARRPGHCVTYLLRADSLRDALLQYAITELGVTLGEDGTLVGSGGGIYHHPLEVIESEQKSSDTFDELEWDEDNDRLLNGSCWEIRELLPQAWEVGCAEIFCSAEPGSIGEYILLCRAKMREDHPRSRARAFVWYLSDGPLVTFHRRKRKAHRWPIEVVGRYLIPWQRQHWPQPYTLTPDMAQEWNGSYDDILDRMQMRPTISL